MTHVHHWKLDPPNGHDATGRCTRCHKRATGMENSTYRSTFNEVLNPAGGSAKPYDEDEAGKIIKRESWT